MNTASSETNTHFAGFWIRAAALGIDLLIYSIVSFIIEQILGHNTLPSKVLILISVASIYVASLSSPWQGTLGKRLLKLQVTHTKYGKIGIKQAVLRMLAVILPALPMIACTFHPVIIELVLELQEKLQGGLLQEEFLSWMAHANKYRPLMLMYGYSTIFFLISLFFWYLPAAFTSEKKSVPDMLCHTRVVRKPSTAS